MNLSSDFRPGTPVGHREFPTWHGCVQPDCCGRCRSGEDVYVHWVAGIAPSGRPPHDGWYLDEVLVPESDGQTTGFGGIKFLFSCGGNPRDGQHANRPKMAALGRKAFRPARALRQAVRHG